MRWRLISETGLTVGFSWPDGTWRIGATVDFTDSPSDSSIQKRPIQKVRIMVAGF
jgi:hypothetical protein